MVKQNSPTPALTLTEARARLIAEGKAGTVPRPTDPQKLPLTALHAAPDVFQMRHPLLSLSRLPEAVAALWRLIRQGIALDPMTVWWSGQRWIVLDGHHRLDAYRADAKDRGTPEGDYAVPVAVFTGTLEEAEKEAGRENAKVRNPVNNQERQEWAWRLLVSGSETSPTAIVKATGVSRMQPYRMRDRKAALEAEGMTAAEMIDLGWWRCQNGGTPANPEGGEAFKAKLDDTADRLFKALDKEFGGAWHKMGDMFAYAFAERATGVAKVMLNSPHLWPLVQSVQQEEWDAEREEDAMRADTVRRNSGKVEEGPF